jgi:hypothetical protein
MMHNSEPINMMSAISAQVQSGSLRPLMLIFFRAVVIGRARSEMTTATNMYMMTLLKYQHKTAIKLNMAAKRMYLASLSVYFSLSINKYF